MDNQQVAAQFEKNLLSNLNRAAKSRNASFIAKLLLSKVQELNKAPTTLREFRNRIQTLPRLSRKFGESSGFAMPMDLTDSMMRLTTGMLSSKNLGKANLSLIDEPITMLREMLMYAYEAKPRPLSFAITGYSPSEFISYIYQDVAFKDMERPDLAEMPFYDAVDEVREWLREPVNNHVRSARRHIRRRLMGLLDRTNHQAGSLFEDREVNTDMMYLFFKLLERDEDEGFTQGDIRPFDQVRDDFSLLAQFCTYKRYRENADVLDSFMRVRCPGMVEDFESEIIDLPRSPRAKAKALREGKKPGAPSARKAAKRTNEEDPFAMLNDLS